MVKIISLTLTFEHVNWKSIGVIYPLEAFLVSSVATFHQMGQRYSTDIIYTKTSTLNLTFDHVTWKSTGVIFSPGAFTVSSLTNFQQRDKKILYRHHLYIDQQFDLNLWPCDLKINRGHLLPTGKQRGQKRTLLGLQTDQQVQNNMPSFFNRGHKRCITISYLPTRIQGSWLVNAKFPNFAFII